ncbi:hypothetical protein [Pannonibacter phragmitetus]|nr:hypothetical protein [Pannonibacter phragmitetus]
MTWFLIFPDWLRPGLHASGLAQFLDFAPVFSGAVISGREKT